MRSRYEAPLEGERWRRRLALSCILRVIAALGPLVAAIAVGMLVNQALPGTDGTFSSLIRFAVVFVASMGTLIGVDRLARRLLPLALLLRLSLTFPDRAPSRFTIAMRAASPRRLAAAAESLHDGSMSDTETVVTLAAALNAHDRRTRGHSERVRAFSDLIGQELKLSEAQAERLRWAAFLHDVGKLTVPAKVLNKPGKLDSREWGIVRGHPAAGRNYAKPLRSWLGDWIHAVDQHHEKFDGSGYPDGLAGKKISLGGRIVAVADSFETMTAVRSYNKPKTPEAAREELTRCAGTHFDPHVVRAMLGVSIGRLRWRIGVAAWLAQVPFLGMTARASAQAVTTAAGVEAGAGSMLGALAVSIAGVATPVAATVGAVTWTDEHPPAASASESTTSTDPDGDGAASDTTTLEQWDDSLSSHASGGPGDGTGPGNGAGQGLGGPGDGAGPGNGAGQGGGYAYGQVPDGSPGNSGQDNPGQGNGVPNGGVGQGNGVPNGGVGQGNGTPNGGVGQGNGNAGH